MFQFAARKTLLSTSSPLLHIPSEVVIGDCYVAATRVWHVLSAKHTTQDELSCLAVRHDSRLVDSIPGFFVPPCSTSPVPGSGKRNATIHSPCQGTHHARFRHPIGHHLESNKSSPLFAASPLSPDRKLGAVVPSEVQSRAHEKSPTM